MRNPIVPMLGTVRLLLVAAAMIVPHAVKEALVPGKGGREVQREEGAMKWGNRSPFSGSLRFLK
ncbi:MAG: hypothetical protein RLZZ416_465 [Candidatus Parcubacteria bacterium]|jgi:hypothetical protein